MCGCLAENPAYDGTSAGASETGGEVTTAPTSTTTTGATSSSTSTGEEVTAASATEATTSAPAMTTGAGMSASLRHYDPRRCDEPLWCFGGGDVWNGVPGEVRGAECFEAPIAPPFRVRRIDYTLVATREAPRVRFEVRSGDLSQVLYTSETLVLPETPGSLHIPPGAQPIVEDGRFCVGFVGGDHGSAIGFGADASAIPPPLQSFFGSDACSEPGLRDVNLFVPEIIPHGPWCLGAEIVGI